jgi:hypothetical protein
MQKLLYLNSIFRVCLAADGKSIVCVFYILVVVDVVAVLRVATIKNRELLK